MSVVRATALDQTKRYTSAPHEAPLAHPRGKRNFALLYVAGLLVVLGLAALIGVVIFTQTRSVAAPQSPYPSVIFAEATNLLSADNLASSDLKRSLGQARVTGGTLGSIVRIIPTATTAAPDGTSQPGPMSLKDFLTAIGAQESGELIQALDSSFFLGIHIADKNAPVMIIPVTSYEHAFSGMLAWEATMNDDLQPLFSAVPDQIVGSDGLPQKRAFTDTVMQNYDVRALKDDGGTIEMYYSFPTRNILIIAENPNSFNEVLLRLRAERKL